MLSEQPRIGYFAKIKNKYHPINAITIANECNDNTKPRGENNCERKSSLIYFKISMRNMYNLVLRFI